MMYCLDKVSVARDAVLEDVPLYAQMLRNDEWLKDSGFDKAEFETDGQIEQFISKEHPDDIKWLVFHEHKGLIGFAHFKVISDAYAVSIGGILPSILNSGLGIKYFVKCIDLYFKLGNLRTLRHNIYQENLRSCKIHVGMGDQLVGLKICDNKKYDVFETEKIAFYNSSLIKRMFNSDK